MRDKWTGKRFEMTTNVVLVQEEDCRVDKVDWLLIANQPIATYDEVMTVVRGYAQRWRIEEKTANESVPDKPTIAVATLELTYLTRGSSAFIIA